MADSYGITNIVQSINESAMQVDAANDKPIILCCNCGTSIEPNPAVMCIGCINLTSDITSGISREGTVHFCRGCERYLRPPHQWAVATLESRELLSICLDKIRGLTVEGRRLIDASYIWTEPHSRRILLKITVQKEAFPTMQIQQTFEVEFYVQYVQCPDCAKTYTPNTWKANVQVRQKVLHKRTFLYLEQLILAQQAHREASNIKEVHQGLDFHFQLRQHAIKLVEFLTSNVPVRLKKSEELISTDIHTSVSNYKFTYSVEIVPICKDDLVVLPSRLARSLGNISPLLLCIRIGNALHMIDPVNLELRDISASIYWREPFKAIAESSQLIEYIVLDVELVGATSQKYFLADITIFQTDAPPLLVRSHLGGILQPGDTVLGYQLSTSNINSPLFDALPSHMVPDIVLVRKSYRDRRKKNKGRNWKLKNMEKDKGDLKSKKHEEARIERDYEEFLQSLEEDEDMRSSIKLYKAEVKKPTTNITVENANVQDDQIEKYEIEDYIEIPVEELLDEFEEMKLVDR